MCMQKKAILDQTTTGNYKVRSTPESRPVQQQHRLTNTKAVCKKGTTGNQKVTRSTTGNQKVRSPPASRSAGSPDAAADERAP